MIRKWLFLAGLIMVILIQFLQMPQLFADGKGKQVYIIPIEDNVERGLEAFLNRTTSEAKELGADHIIFEIDTPGGRVDSAGQIGELLSGLDIPNTAFIVNQAYSAGSYIALNADQIYMKPQASIGSSGVIDSAGNAADKKAQSAWRTAMMSAAEANGRDPLYAQAMADASIDLPEYRAGEGEYLTLYPKEAVEVGYAEGIVGDRIELLAELNLSEAKVIETSPTFAENLARIITHPVVVPILLSVASLGLIVELYSPGFGIPGIMGLLSLVLFFFGHIVAELATYESLILIVIGVICIALELFVPGGVLGIVGAAAVLGSLLLASNDIGHMAMSIGIALLVSIAASVIMFKTMGMEKGFFRHIILNDATTSEKGYVSSKNRLELIGLIGETISPLRPSGTAMFDDERIDVVTEGSYISEKRKVKIVKTEGSRIVVREINN